jgi:predicted transcriptional regulator
MSRFYTLDDYGTSQFYQLEKVLFVNPIYRYMSLGSKTTYAILRDRQDLSIKNKWLDTNGYIFFYFDCENLAELMNISTSTVNKYKKELIDAKLLFNKRQGQGKPNKLYILKPVNVDLTLISENHSSRIANNLELEIRKSLANDTEWNELNETKLSSNMIFLTENTSTFLETFKSYFGYEHRKIKSQPNDDNLEDFTQDELVELFIEYFDKYSTGNKKRDKEQCSIENVFTSFARVKSGCGW